MTNKIFAAIFGILAIVLFITWLADIHLGDVSTKVYLYGAIGLAIVAILFLVFNKEKTNTPPSNTMQINILPLMLLVVPLGYIPLWAYLILWAICAFGGWFAYSSRPVITFGLWAILLLMIILKLFGVC